MSNIIILHGLGQSASDWDMVINQLNRPATVLPLFNGIREQSDMSLDALNDHISNELDKITEPFYLVGLSLGGLLTLSYTVNSNNPYLKGIIISGAIYKPIPKWLSFIQTSLFHVLPKSQFENLGMTRYQMIQLVSSINVNLTDDLKGIDIPTLILCGEKDTANIKSSKEIHSLISHSEFNTIPNGKHELNKDSIHELAEYINQFIKKKESI